MNKQICTSAVKRLEQMCFWEGQLNELYLATIEERMNVPFSVEGYFSPSEVKYIKLSSKVKEEGFGMLALQHNELYFKFIEECND